MVRPQIEIPDKALAIFWIFISVIKICLDLLPRSRKGSRVMSDNVHIIIQNTPLSPYTRHLAVISVVTPFLQFTASAGDKKSERGSAVRNNT